jgi:hypothetical protein
VPSQQVFVVTVEIATYASSDISAEELVLNQLAVRRRLGGVLSYQSVGVATDWSAVAKAFGADRLAKP